MSTAILKAPILAVLQTALLPLGYKKAAALFMRPTQDVVHMIEVQGANTNTASHASFTVNVGVYAQGLDEPTKRAFTGPSLPAAHWRERLGFLAPGHADIWWTMDSKPEAETAARDMAAHIARYALPVLQKLNSRAALQALWQSGQSPGLSSAQRQAHLDRMLS